MPPPSPDLITEPPPTESGIERSDDLLSRTQSGDKAQQLSLSFRSRSAALHSFRPSASSHRSLSSELVRTFSTARMAMSAKSGGISASFLLVHSRIWRGFKDDAVSSFPKATNDATTSAAATTAPLSGASTYS